MGWTLLLPPSEGTKDDDEIEDISVKKPVYFFRDLNRVKDINVIFKQRLISIG